MRAHRGRCVGGCFIAAAALIALTMSSDWRDEAIAPGPLSNAHAQLIRDRSMKRCASCHQAGEAGLAEWTLRMIGARRPEATSQSELCLECHHNHVPPRFALQAHSWDKAKLARITDLALRAAAVSGKPTDDHPTTLDELACARCHQEHRGADHNMKQLTSGQCNTCHVRQFSSFASHPDFDTWPNGRRTRIVFDHRQHEFKHFPESKQDYRCAVCHAIDDTNEPVRAVNYRACASCHDEKIQRSLEAPLALIQLPTIDVDALRAEGLVIGDWPSERVGEFEGTVSPLLHLMLWADPSTQVALRHFGSQVDFGDVDPDNFDDLEAASELVWGIKLFLYELSTDGPAAIMRRAQKLADGMWREDELLKLVIGFEARQAAALANAQFKDLRGDLAGRLPKSDVAEELEAACRVSTAPNVVWSYDAARCSIRVHVEDHANPLLTGWLKLAARMGPAEPKLRPALLRPEGPGQCTSCHSLDLGPGLAALRVNWFSLPNPSSLDRPFTKFAHSPHLLQPPLTECRECHQLDRDADYLSGYTSTNVFGNPCNFQPMDRAACAVCHITGGAGEDCAQCHHYHVR